MSSPLLFKNAQKFFLRALEKEEVAYHTFLNYKLDLKSFDKFLKKTYQKNTVDLKKLHLKDLRCYFNDLKKKQLKTNTRRRKLLTIRKFLRYLTQKKKISSDFSETILAPFKIEKIPFYLPISLLMKKNQSIHPEGSLKTRNQLLLSVLIETGCRPSEISLFLRTHLKQKGEHYFCCFETPFSRWVPISKKLFEQLQAFPNPFPNKPFFFYGYNQFGPLKNPISSRGIELLVKAYAKLWNIPLLTPRTFRHSVFFHWLEENVPKTEIQKRLGLRSLYRFKKYEILKQSQKKKTSRTHKGHEKIKE